jgi:choline dehydrogenase-like flavoprotein
MFTIRFKSLNYRPDLQVTLRNNVDGWNLDIPGIYDSDEWRFELAEVKYQQGFNFKFVLERTYWMEGQDFYLQPFNGGNYVYDEGLVRFPPITEMVVENNYVQNLFFKPNLDENHLFDVIVIGSGIGGGILADQLSDLGVDVLVLEAGSYVFPTHVANLPRQHQVGKFEKHIWGLFDEFKVQNYANTFGSQYAGGQSFNLGGRSVFWGGLIPRMTSWEMELWPTDIKWYLEDGGYQRAEDEMNRIPLQPTTYHRNAKTFLRNLLPEFNPFDAPMAVQYSNNNLGTIPAGMFSTADLLMESRLTDGPTGNQNLSINLNHPVVQLKTSGTSVTEVVAYDLIARKYRSYKAKRVVLSAGTVESAKLARLSQLLDPNGKIGIGITDHPIFFTHFSIPANSPFYSATDSSKILLQHKQASANAHPYNIVLELGADFNQGRYIDTDILKRHNEQKGNNMLCELVFLFNAPLIDNNRVDQIGPSFAKPLVQMQPSPVANGFYAEINGIKDQIIQQLGGEAIQGDNLLLNQAGLGGVAHEVGTLRMGAKGDGVVDANLKFLSYDNLYACDLSVFPSSPAANPTLTLAALAVRLAEHLKAQL